MQLERPLDLSKIVENGGATAKPLIIGSIIYMGAMDANFYAIDVETGNKKWELRTNGPIFTTAAFDGNALYFGSFDTHLYAISLKGEVLWKFKTNALIASSPAIKGNIIYFGSSDHNLYAVDLQTHQKVWHFEVHDEIVSDVAIIKNRIYFGSMDNYFYCLGLDGNLIWKFRTNAPILMGEPTFDDNAVYFGSADETLYAVNFDGKLKWGFKTAEEVYNTAVIRDSRVYFTSRDRHVYCLDAKSGACIWKFRTEIDLLCPPLVSENQIFCAAEEIYALNTEGYLIWKSSLDFDMGLNGVVWNDKIIFGALDCKIRSIKTNGHLLWTFHTNGVMAPIESFQEVQSAPKWNPHLFEPEVVKKSTTFNPYAFNENGLKIYGGINTTGAEAYVGERRDVGAYRRKGEYIEKDKKKKVLDEILEDQVKQQWGI